MKQIAELLNQYAERHDIEEFLTVTIYDDCSGCVGNYDNIHEHFIFDSEEEFLEKINK